jgi:hypothetical protein
MTDTMHHLESMRELTAEELDGVSGGGRVVFPPVPPSDGG